MNRLRRIEQFFDRLGIDETRLDEVSWLADQIKMQHEGNPSSADIYYRPEEIMDQLGPRASVSWIRQLMPLLQSMKRVQQIPSAAHAYPKSSPMHAGVCNALQAILSESGDFVCPAPKPVEFPTRVPLSVLNKTMFELSVYDSTQYLGPVAGTKATSWGEEMRFPLPWLVPEPNVQESLLVLPPMDQMLELIEWMIQSPLYTYFPILTKASILNALSSAVPGTDTSMPDTGKPQSHSSVGREIGDLPQRITGRVSAVFLLNAIMALGAAYRSNAIKENKSHRLLIDPKSKERNLQEFQVFFDRSRALTVYILDQPRISSLQGLLLLMKCPAIPGIQNLYREQSCAMALSLGLHRDPEPWTLCRSVIQLRRNLFWCCYVIDASYSLNSGSPERFPDDYITVGLPTLPSIESGDDIGEIDAENETQRIGFLIEQAKLWKIVKKIRRCGQTSNKSSDSYCEGSNLYRSTEASTPSSMSNVSPSFGYSGNGSAGSNYGEPKTPTSASTPPLWVWRADSARRILDVELAQWQMDLPQHLRFDFALTRKDDPCPFAVRVNGLGAMLQVIFNEVLILLHHPFLILADSQSQSKQEQNAQVPARNSKSRSSTSSTKTSRSRSSSSASKPSFSSSVPSSADDNAIKASRSLPPFLNTCTKAAEAITFLIDHLLNTTPEWLVCHNEVDSALHIAERVHTLNVTMVTNNSAPGGAPMNGSGYVAHVNSQQAKCQLRRTKAFRKTIKELDQFTMSAGCRPELLTKELIARGFPRERLMRSVRQMLAKRINPEYYRLPRSPPEEDSSISGSQPDSDGHLENGTRQDHLDMRLSFIEQRIWIRYYNVHIKDGIESKNGAESWQEILNPFTPPSELAMDSEEEEEEDHGNLHLLGYPISEDMPLSPLEGKEPYSNDLGKQRAQKRRGGSRAEKKGRLSESIDPPQSSTTALIEFFSNPNPSGFEGFPGMVGGSTYYPDNHPFADKKDLDKNYDSIEAGFDTSMYYPGQYTPQGVPLDNFERMEPTMSVGHSPQGQSHSTDLFQSEQQLRGFQVDSNGSHIHQHHQQQQQQRQRQHTYNSSESYPQTSFELQQQSHQQRQQHGSYSSFDLHSSSVVSFDTANPTSPFSSPEPPNLTSTTEAMSLNLLSVSTPLSLQSSIAFDGGPYLNLLQQHIPHSQMIGTSSVQSFQQQHPLDSSLNGMHQTVRPFYGMPMGGFMAPSLDSLPVISRAVPAHQNSNAQQANFLPSPPPHQGQQQSGTWSLDAQTTPGTSYMAKSEPPSPALPPSLCSSISTSPLPQSPLRMMLSPTSDAMQGISNRLNSWDGLSGPKADTQIEYPNTSSSSAFQSATAGLDQHGGGNSHYVNGWSSSSTSEMMNGNSTSASAILSDGASTGVYVSSLSSGPTASGATTMDGIEAGSSPSSSPSILSGNNSNQHQQHRHLISAVPEAPFGDFATSNPDDSVRFYRPHKKIGGEMNGEASSGIAEGDTILSLRVIPVPSGGGARCI
ncbi:hypothetical protein BGX27_007591 [Mortierella sp. AM989]|nr:hypothetical protein BGX27_007591 [Mortierella sp. AM989]